MLLPLLPRTRVARPSRQRCRRIRIPSMTPRLGHGLGNGEYQISVYHAGMSILRQSLSYHTTHQSCTGPSRSLGTIAKTITPARVASASRIFDMCRPVGLSSTSTLHCNLLGRDAICGNPHNGLPSTRAGHKVAFRPDLSLRPCFADCTSRLSTADRFRLAWMVDALLYTRSC